MSSERPVTRSGSTERPQTSREAVERPVTRWRRDDRPMTRSGVVNPAEMEEANRKPIENRPVSRRGLKDEVSTDRLPSRAGIEPGVRTAGFNSRIGTASRLSSAMMRAPSRTSAGPVINIAGSQLAGMDRLVTADGLSGMNTVSTSRGVGARQVQDKRYFEGLIQLKMRELGAEITRLNKEVETYAKEHAAFLLYDKRVKEAATELTELQETLADYNLLVDKANTNTEIRDIMEERAELQAANQIATRQLEQLFEERTRKQQLIAEIEEEIESNRRSTEKMITNMSPAMKEQYSSLKEYISTMQERVDKLQEQLDALNFRKAELLDHISSVPIKVEAARLSQKLAELEERRQVLLQEERNKLSPEEEQERLLAQVKSDNAEILSIERGMSMLQDQIKFTKKQIETINDDLEESQSERFKKYQELKKREETIETFLINFESTKSDELQRLNDLETDIVKTLTKMSKHLITLPPSAVEYELLEKDFSSANIFAGDNSVQSLSLDYRQLGMTLEKLNSMEIRIKTEIETLQQKIADMKNDLKKYTDLDSLQDKFEEERKELTNEREELLRMKDTDLPTLQEAKSTYERLMKQLQDNDTYIQLKNLEKRLELIEQNNFALKEYIATKEMETNFEPVKNRTLELMNSYNSALKEELVVIRK
nr:PREDICTED: intraflagellar transport protein 74 homolog [Bemisia tabaci]